MRYLNNDPPSTTSFATKMTLQPSQNSQSKTLVTSYGRSLATRNPDKGKAAPFHHEESIFLKRHNRSRMKTEPVESSTFL